MASEVGRAAASYTVDENWSIDVVVDLFERIREVQVGARRFHWLYNANPEGEAQVWVLRANGDPVGFTACLPRAVWVNGQRRRGLIGSDFTVDPAHRTLGPAVKLRRAARSLIDSGRYDLLYSHPMPAMVPVHARVGHPQIGEMARWVLPLRAGDTIRRKLGNHVAARPFAGVFDAALKAVRTALRLTSPFISVREAKEADEDHDRLDVEVGSFHPVVGARHAAYINWHFLQRTGRQTMLLQARNRRGDLRGYLLLDANAPYAQIRDLIAAPKSGARRALLMTAATIAAAGGAATLNFALLRGSEAAEGLGRLGFFERQEQQATVCYGGAQFGDKAIVERSSNWYMTVGDRDI